MENEKELLSLLRQIQSVISKNIDRFDESYQKDRLWMAYYQINQAVTELIVESRSCGERKKYGSS